MLRDFMFHRREHGRILAIYNVWFHSTSVPFFYWAENDMEKSEKTNNGVSVWTAINGSDLFAH